MAMVHPRPLLFGRLLRVLAGLLALYWGAHLWGPNLGSVLLILLGVSFVVGGLRAIPGCEITALPNLLLRKPLHLY